MPGPLNLSGVSFERLIDPNSMIVQTPPTTPPPPPSEGFAPKVENPSTVPPPQAPPQVPNGQGTTPPTTPSADPNAPNPSEEELGELTPLGFFKQTLGYEVEGEFEDNLDGMVNYTRAAIPIAARQILDEFFEEFPESRMLAEHLKAGNSVETFAMQFQKPEFTKIELNASTDFNVLEKIVRQNLIEKNYSKDDIDMVVNSAKEKNSLLAKAKTSQQEIGSRYDASVSGQKEAEIAKIKQDQLEAEKTLRTVNEIITRGTLPNGVIPDADKKAFTEFILKVGDDGKTARDKVAETMSIEELVALDYLLYKNMNRSKAPVDNSKKAIYDTLLGDRNLKRMDGTGEKPKQPSKSKDPRSSLDGLEFNTLIS